MTRIRSTGVLLSLLAAPLLLGASCHKAPRIEPPAVRPPHVVPAPVGGGAEDVGAQSERALVRARAAEVRSSYTRQTVDWVCKIRETYQNLSEEDVEGLIYQGGEQAGVRAAAAYSLLAELEDADSSSDAIDAKVSAAVCGWAGR